MIAPKPKLSLLLACLLVIASFVLVRCSDNTSEKVDSSTTDTIKMDTATTRPPVKTTN